MTTIYFVRHAEPNFSNHKDSERELTEKGMRDRELVTTYLSDKSIDIVVSSPYKRAIDTVKHFADLNDYKIEIVDDFRERKADDGWIDDFSTFSKTQWNDFNYKLSEGETLGEVQERNVNALSEVLSRYKNKNVVVGSHGTALSTIINYYDQSFGYKDYKKIKMPWIAKFTFHNDVLNDIEYSDISAKQL